MDYKAYLASREWAVLKERVRERSGGYCERCLTAPYQETHHLTYERTGSERLEDLLGVCSPCHAYLSAKSNVDPCNVPRRTLLPGAVPSYAVQAAPPDRLRVWACVCGAVNHPADGRCGGCFKVRNPEAYRGPWTCCICDHENEARYKYYCEMCGSERVVTAPAG